MLKLSVEGLEHLVEQLDEIDLWVLGRREYRGQPDTEKAKAMATCSG